MNSIERPNLITQRFKVISSRLEGRSLSFQLLAWMLRRCRLAKKSSSAGLGFAFKRSSGSPFFLLPSHLFLVFSILRIGLTLMVVAFFYWDENLKYVGKSFFCLCHFWRMLSEQVVSLYILMTCRTLSTSFP